MTAGSDTGMRPLTQRLEGALYEGEEGKTGLLLTDAAGRVAVRYGVVVLGTERVVFPALALDDWGNERKTMALYRWIYEEGQRFPRAEVFGFTAEGRETQIFLRDLEIFMKYPLFAYGSRKAPVEAGRRVDVILLPDEEGAGPAGEVPPEIGWPLRHAAVRWERVDVEEMAAAGWEPVAENSPPI